MGLKDSIRSADGNKMKKKILFISHENNLGGGTKSLLSLIQFYKCKQDFEMTVLVKKKHTALTDMLDLLGIPYICAPNFWIRSKNNNFIKAFFKQSANFFVASLLILSGKVNKKRFDIIHTNSSVSSFGVILSYLTKIKHIWHFREFGDLDFGLTYPIQKKLIFPFFCKNTFRFVFISKTLSNYYRSLIPPSKKVVIHNGFNLIDFSISKKKFDIANIRLLISGSFSPGKKQDTAIKAISILQSLGIYASLTIAGSGDSVYENYLKELAIEEGVSEYVKFIGYQEDISLIRKEIDIELVCSKAEAFGRVTIEAMLMGLIVVASNTGANTELIKHAWNGMLYEFDNEYNLAQQIAEVVQDPELRAFIRYNAIEYSNRKFDIANTANAVSSLYD
ncbi:hypothetical protein BB778_09160 [Pluralibacter gergoviae]|nr:hypothetical protein BB778_09160 [Pluralibacter gergoviae]